MTPDSYAVFAVRYATRETMASQVYLNHHVYGELDHPMKMDYFFWVLRNAERTIVVDTGFTPEVGDRRGRTTTCPVPEGLRRLDIDPGGVRQLVVTHAHYDHTGNLDLFTGAEVVISGRELDFWTGPYASRTQFAHSAEPPDLAALADLDKQGRITRFSGHYDLAPGVELLEIGGHTPGQAVLIVHTTTGRVVLASDAVHYYEELEADRPFLVVADLQQMYAGFDRVATLAAEPGAVLLPGHDPEVMKRFPPLDPADPEFGVVVSAGEGVR